VARVLLEHVLDEARAAGAYRVSLQTEVDNIPAISLYSAAGFKPVKDLELLNLSLAARNKESQA
jgi:ribosomal protein S18 acetylase RimI-like enzyme